MVGTHAAELLKIDGPWRFAARMLTAEVVGPSA
jgi:hypothetical protein